MLSKFRILEIAKFSLRVQCALKVARYKKQNSGLAGAVEIKKLICTSTVLVKVREVVVFN